MTTVVLSGSEITITTPTRILCMTPTITTITDPSSTTKTINYGGCGCAGGEVATVQDEHGRQKQYTKDSLGRLATVDEFNWNGSIYATTNYTYNIRNQLTQINQAGQVRTF